MAPFLICSLVLTTDWEHHMPQNSATRVSGARRGVRAGLGATYPTLHNFVAQLVLQIRALVLGSAAQRVQGVDDLLLRNVDSAGPSHTRVSGCSRALRADAVYLSQVLVLHQVRCSKQLKLDDTKLAGSLEELLDLLLDEIGGKGGSKQHSQALEVKESAQGTMMNAARPHGALELGPRFLHSALANAILQLVHQLAQIVACHP